MATAKGANNYNRQNWEDSEFPILCQTCLGDNPYLRMTKEKYGKECKICTRPFTIFRWCPGARMRYKKTEICQTCAKLKNICQTCLLDLEYGLPIQVRDEALKIRDDIPRSDVNKEYYIQNRERELALSAAGGELSAAGGSGLKAAPPNDLLLKLARTAPYYKRNRPHICSFWVKGECRRGEECPYRHERPTDPDDPLSDQNIKDRYYGVNDPVAEKMMRRASSMPKLEPPEDRSITTLYIGNIGTEIGEKELRDNFYQFGEIRSITIVAKNQCAFIQYMTRTGAEAAVEGTYNKLIIGGCRLNIKWGRSQGKQGEGRFESSSGAGGAPLLPAVPGLPGPLPMPPAHLINPDGDGDGGNEGSGGDGSSAAYHHYHHPPPPGVMMPMMMHPPLPPPPFMMHPHQGAPLPPPPGAAFMPSVHYPSQDPNRLGAVPSLPPPIVRSAPPVKPPGT